MTIATDPKLLTPKEVQRLLRCSRSKLYRLRRRPDFPRPLLIGTACRWPEAEILAWLAKQPRAEVCR